MTTLIKVRGQFFDSTEIVGEISTLRRFNNVTLPIHLSYRVEILATPVGWTPDGKYESMHQLTAGFGSWKIVYGHLRRFIEDDRLKHLVKVDDERDMMELGKWHRQETRTVELCIEEMGFFRSRVIVDDIPNDTDIMNLEGRDLRKLELVFGNPDDEDTGSATTLGRWSEVQLSSGELHTPFWEQPTEPEEPADDLADLRKSLERIESGVGEIDKALGGAYTALGKIENAQ